MNHMTGKTIRILMLEDSDFDAELVIRELRKGGLDFVWHRVQTREEYRLALKSFLPDLILVDYKLPDFDGGQAIVMAKEICPGVPAIVVTGAVGEDTAVELFKKGATDFVLKDRISGRLLGAVERAIAESINRIARRQAEEQQSQLNAELRRLATHDPLTGAASRTLLLEKVEEAIAGINPQAPETAFFSIDLDSFKQLNATYGANLADQVLVETARRLNALCGLNDLVGNLGGDKFFLLLRRAGLEQELPALLKKIESCFGRPFHLRNLDITVDASIGGVILRIPGETTANILAQCEEAMRQVKLGKHEGIFMVDERIIKELKRRSLLDNEIIEGVKTKSLFLLFQPIVSLETGKIHGAEGLLRFRQKDGSVLPAAEFMDALIRTTSLSLMDEAVISNFLDSSRGQIEPLLQRKDFRFSFNISPGILANVGYAEKILAQISKGGANPNSFTLEILEEGLMPTNGTVRENLSILQQAGIHVAVDDFGIGYSNLVRLSRLPINELKIPRELIGGIKSGDARLKAVLETIVGIAKYLGLLIVAEGVEEQVEADHLRALGCQYAQGYLYGKAMPLEELMTLIGSH
ncbi:MAG: GGDEF domain-containing response regulator [Verrucomicrobia bacterium]|nr:GGDEF domain-containing response regulator [Verrucomicrobiota bacterium]